MLPDTCVGCPLYDPRKDMVLDHIADDAKMNVILLSPTYDALRNGEPDVTEIQRGLRLSGVEDFNVIHMVRCQAGARPKGPGAIGWDSKIGKAAKHCDQYTTLPDLPTVTVGKHVWNFYCKANEDIYNWRGFRY